MKEIFREISIEEIEGFRIGNAQDAEGGSGCTEMCIRDRWKYTAPSQYTKLRGVP